ncbi:MAG: hypothetical protein MR681_07095 [Prevotella sp.]|nr:hypothetical protein [Prevotella sp.]
MAKIKKNPYLPKENVCIPCIKNVALEFFLQIPTCKYFIDERRRIPSERKQRIRKRKESS